MKFSQMTSNQVADIMIQIAPEIETLVNDECLVDMVKNREKTTDTEKAKKIGSLFVLKTATYLLKEHRDSVWNILGSLHEKTSEEIGNQMFVVTFKQTLDVLSDKDFMSFFQSLSV